MNEQHTHHNTLKCVALLKLVEAGVISEAEDGSVDTEGFERFWTKFERNLNTAITDEVNAAKCSLRQKLEEEMKAAEERAYNCGRQGKYRRIALVSATLSYIVSSLFYFVFK